MNGVCRCFVSGYKHCVWCWIWYSSATTCRRRGGQYSFLVWTGLTTHYRYRFMPVHSFVFKPYIIVWCIYSTPPCGDRSQRALTFSHNCLLLVLNYVYAGMIKVASLPTGYSTDVHGLLTLVDTSLLVKHKASKHTKVHFKISDSGVKCFTIGDGTI